jgi:RNA polymerase sigma factor (sigma-70 family)
MLRWNLDSAACRRYAVAIAPFLSDDMAGDQIRDIIANYHAEHALVAALQDSASADHASAWRQWMRQVIAILRREGLAWSNDGAIDSDDLAQIARAELVRALPSYRYQSHFSAWANRVIVQIIRRHIRDSRRAKRAVRPDSLEQLLEIAPLPDPRSNAESAAQARQLYGLIMSILGEQPDRRLGHLFHLAVIEDRRAADIGALVHLQPARVRTLLQQTRRLLSKHPAIQAWLESGYPHSS